MVLKPAIGSWGRLIAKVNDREAAEALLEHKEVALAPTTTRSSTSRNISPSQPAAIFAPSWSATRRSARSTAPASTGSPTPRAAARPATARSRRSWPISARRGAGGRRRRGGDRSVRGADGGLLVNEVNYTMEFRNSIDTTGVNIPARMSTTLSRSAKQNEFAVTSCCFPPPPRRPTIDDRHGGTHYRSG